MLDKQYISDLKNDVNVKTMDQLTRYDRRMLAIDIFENGNNIQKLSAMEAYKNSFDIIKAMPVYAKKTTNDNEKIDLALKIADSILDNITHYHEEDIEEYFL